MTIFEQRVIKKGFQISIFLILIFLRGSAFSETSERITVFAAASTTNVVSEVAQIFELKEKTKIILSFAASSTLAKQIERGALVDVYLSANSKWVDYLKDKGMIAAEQVYFLFSNQLVLIAPGQGVGPTYDIKDFPFQTILKDQYLAMADPSHTPAGNYAKKALEYYGVWQNIKSRIAPMKDVRSALRLVERQETPLGIVYATDARISNKIKILSVFPSISHPPIEYMAAAIGKQPTPEIQKFLIFLQSKTAQALYAKHGFKINKKGP